MKVYPRHRLRGFTLVELLVVITIIIILVAVSAPTIIGFREQRHLTSAGQMIQGSFIQARSLAISKRLDMYVVFFAEDAAIDVNFIKKNGQTFTLSLQRKKGSIHVFFLDESGGSPQVFQVGQPEELPNFTEFETPASNTVFRVMPDGRIIVPGDGDTDIVVTQTNTPLKCFMDVVPNTGRVAFFVDTVE